ncbi:PspC domain-containing protein [Dolosicoccus paucivorans]|uniref:PspC domain-containing protein n=1 Tax=Dolosicoccus paucivorans TaxID=84521 RepID=A0A1G8MRA0_9LACT|nr:PspC domain-containing protein [Dolosicoccus paucivorans]PMB84165.1 PspC domain-containing protein [Dolosicoccus paucivorans]PMC58415.1 PspC domain-containing protein [Dolosicoccus paucivorans]SDI70444.1 phage shock protein C (PspC) family protein [Dolosicoccus paucivorans]
MRKLYKSSTNKMLAGVCGGLAEYFNVDPTLVRIIFGVLFLSGSIGIWLYILLALILPYDYQVNEQRPHFKQEKPTQFDQFFADKQAPKDVTEEDWSDF